MSESNFHRNHEQHISISEKLSEELNNTGKDILKQICDQDQKLSDQILIKIVNGIVGGIYTVIPNLQDIVIKSNADHETNADLKDVVKKLSQYCNDMVQGYDGNSDTLNQKFKEFLKNILLGSESLLNVIKKDALHDFKHELVENLKEMMYMIQRSQARIRIENYNEEELKDLIKAIHKQYFDDIAILKNCSLDVLKTVAVHIKYNTKHIFVVAYHLNKVASNYPNVEIQNKILKAAHLLNFSNSAALLINDSLTDTEKAVDALTKYVLEGWNAINELFEFLDMDLENKKESENLRDIILFVISYGVVINAHIGKSVKNDSVFD